MPFRLTSTIRCEAHNRAVGGVATSAHLSGHAVDIMCGDDLMRYVLLNVLISAGFNRLGLGPGFIHVDNHPAKNLFSCWLYSQSGGQLVAREA